MRSQRQTYREPVLSRLLRDQRGALITIVGLAIIPLFGAIGLSIDASRAYLVKSRLWSAVDAAALAGGRVYASATRDDDVRMYFETNFPDGYMGATLEPLEIVPDDLNRTITVTARATIPTTFMRVLGAESIPIVATSEVTLEANNLEVALVLDITGSMAGQRIIDLIDAANQLVDIVVQDVQEPFYSKIALVPYAAAVNVGSEALAQQVRGPYTPGETCWDPGCEEYRFETANHDWEEYRISTCATERTGPEAYTDAAPSVALLGRHYPPPGTYNPCPASAIVPLTSDRSVLHAEIDDFVARGSTAGHIGIAWGWYMISPNFAYLWDDPDEQPAAYDAEDLIKVAILMTDGEFNTVYYNGVVAEDSTSGSGDDDHKIDHDSVNGSPDDQALALCTAMKAAGIVVYTVGLDIAGTSTKDRMEQCATDPSYAYFPEDGAELKQHFRAIAMKVSTLRLSM